MKTLGILFLLTHVAQAASWDLSAVVQSGVRYTYTDYYSREFEDPAWVKTFESGTTQQIVETIQGKAPHFLVAYRLAISMQGWDRLEVQRAVSIIQEKGIQDSISGFSWEKLGDYAFLENGGLLPAEAWQKVNEEFKKAYFWGPDADRKFKLWAAKRCHASWGFWSWGNQKACFDALMAQMKTLRSAWLNQAEDTLDAPNEFLSILEKRETRLLVARTAIRLHEWVEKARAGESWSSDGLYPEMMAICNQLGQSAADCELLVPKILFVVARQRAPHFILAKGFPPETHLFLSALSLIGVYALELDRSGSKLFSAPVQQGPVVFDRFREFWSFAYPARLLSRNHGNRSQAIAVGSYFLAWADETRGLNRQEEPYRALMTPYLHGTLNQSRIRLGASWLGANWGAGITVQDDYGQIVKRFLDAGRPLQLSDDQVDEILLQKDQAQNWLEQILAPGAVLGCSRLFEERT